MMVLPVSDFKAGRTPILVATDVAARGLGMRRRNDVFSLHFIFILTFKQGCVIVKLLQKCCCELMSFLGTHKSSHTPRE